MATIEQKLHQFNSCYPSVEKALEDLIAILVQNPPEHTLTVTLARAAATSLVTPVYKNRYANHIQRLQEQLIRFDIPPIEDADFCDALPCFHMPTKVCGICLGQLCTRHSYRHEGQAYCWRHYPRIH